MAQNKKITYSIVFSWPAHSLYQFTGNNTMRQLYIIIIVLFVTSCQQENTNQKYINKINSWHQKRVEQLTQPDGWLSLAGLYWLQPGVNTFGSNSANDLIFPPKAPENMGALILKDSTIRIQINKNITVTSSGEKIDQMKVTTDEDGEPTVFKQGSLSWYVIVRSNKPAVRLRDSKNKNITSFKGIERFPVNKEWRVKATFHPFNHPKKVMIPTVTGQPTEMIAPGLLEFTLAGETVTLRPVRGSTDDGQFFVIFGDKTNGELTYGGGRFLYVNVPGKDNTTFIDFNKAYNPPCAFTKFATCPLPTATNRLPIKIEAGERNYGHHAY